MIAPGAELRQQELRRVAGVLEPRPGRRPEAGAGQARRQRRGSRPTRSTPFYALLGAASPPPAAGARILERFPGFLGIARSPEGAAWVQVSTLIAGPAYDSAAVL